MCESVMQVACQVTGNDAAITLGGMGGIGSLLQLNVAMPMMAANLLDAITLLANVATVFTDRCLKDLKVNKKIATAMVEQSLMMITSLAPEIGYDEAARVAKAAFASGQTVREYVLEHGLLDPARLDELLDARSMTEPAR
jgi:fumarate hydratase class II